MRRSTLVEAVLQDGYGGGDWHARGQECEDEAGDPVREFGIVEV
jgi:hypothetical protein